MKRVTALAGAKPENAFFVNVGLGKTMTSQDILEGRLIVEIGMAVVRPAAERDARQDRKSGCVYYLPSTYPRRFIHRSPQKIISRSADGANLGARTDVSQHF